MTIRPIHNTIMNSVTYVLYRGDGVVGSGDMGNGVVGSGGVINMISKEHD